MAGNKFDSYERNRQKGMAMLKQGNPVAKIANSLGVSRQTVYNWMKRGTGDKARIRPGGRPRKLDERQRAKLRAILDKSPRNFNFAADNWTGERIAEVIRKQFGVRFNPKSIPQMLRSWGWEWRKKSAKARARRKVAQVKVAKAVKKAKVAKAVKKGRRR